MVTQSEAVEAMESICRCQENRKILYWRLFREVNKERQKNSECSGVRRDCKRRVNAITVRPQAEQGEFAQHISVESLERVASIML